MVSLVFRKTIFLALAGNGTGSMLGMISGLVVWGIRFNQP